MGNEQLQVQLTQLLRPFRDQVSISVQQNDQTLFAHRSDQLLPSASLIKLPILAGTLAAIDAGRLTLAQTIQVSSNQLVGGSGVLQILTTRNWTLADLLALIIADSDNSATNIVIDTVGLTWLQEWIAKQSTDAVLARRLMDFSAAQAGQENKITAEAALKFLQICLSSQQTFSESISNWFKHQQFRDKLPGAFDDLDWPITVFNKTGEDAGIDHDVARFEAKNGSQLDIAMLTAGIPDRSTTLVLFNQIGKILAEGLMLS